MAATSATPPASRAICSMPTPSWSTAVATPSTWPLTHSAVADTSAAWSLVLPAVAVSWLLVAASREEETDRALAASPIARMVWAIASSVWSMAPAMRPNSSRELIARRWLRSPRAAAWRTATARPSGRTVVLVRRRTVATPTMVATASASHRLRWTAVAVRSKELALPSSALPAVMAASSSASYDLRSLRLGPSARLVAAAGSAR